MEAAKNQNTFWSDWIWTMFLKVPTASLFNKKWLSNEIEAITGMISGSYYYVQVFVILVHWVETLHRLLLVVKLAAGFTMFILRIASAKMYESLLWRRSTEWSTAYREAVAGFQITDSWYGQIFAGTGICSDNPLGKTSHQLTGQPSSYYNTTALNEPEREREREREREKERGGDQSMRSCWAEQQVVTSKHKQIEKYRLLITRCSSSLA